MVRKHFQMPLFYIHLPSCGGTTLWSILRVVYGKDKIRRCIPNKDFQDRFEAIPDVQTEFAEKTVIGGHAHYSLANEKCPDRQLITVLRDPVERMASVYYRRIRNGRWKPSITRGRKDILQFCKTEVRFQLQRYFSSSGGGEASEDTCESAVDDRAKDIMNLLENRFAVFGILEHFNRSLFLFRDSLNWDAVPTYDQRNIGGNRPQLIEPDVRGQMEELLQVDCRVYRFALKLFEKRWLETSSASRSAEMKEYQASLEARRLYLLQTNDGKNPYVKFRKRMN